MRALPVCLAVPASLLFLPAVEAAKPVKPKSSATFQQTLMFEPNEGQAAAGVRFLARSSGAMTLLREDGVTFGLRTTRTHPDCKGKQCDRLVHREDDIPEARMLTVGLRFEGGGTSKLSGEDQLASYSSYFVGTPDQWRRGVKNYGRVRQAGVYPGIDVMYYGKGPQLEFDLVVKRGADPKRIALRWDGVKGMRLNEAGALVLATEAGDLTQHAPAEYQEIGGQRVKVAARYRLNGKSVRFELGRYDRGHDLVIDPVLSYSTYLGTTNNEFADGIAVDSAKNAYVCGRTAAANFPLGFAPGNTLSGDFDAFVLKLNPTGTAVIYSLYIGGTAFDGCHGLAIDTNNNAYLVGRTQSDNFPMVNPFDATRNGVDYFVTKVNAAGNALVYSTYLGGSGAEFEPVGNAIAVDERGHAYIGGQTASNDYPTTLGAFDTTFNGQTDGVVTKFDPAGNTLTFPTYLGGASEDTLNGLTIDGAANVYVTGITFSTDFPTTAGVFSRTLGLPDDVFVTKINATGSGLSYSTFVGGTSSDYGQAIAVDAFGRAHVTGVTFASNFPTTAGAYDTTFAGTAVDGFVFKLNSDGSGLLFSTFIGGTGSENPTAIAVDNAGNTIIGGGTQSNNFPVTGDAIDNVQQDFDGFLSMLNPTGSTLLYSTLWGGIASDSINGIAVDADRDVYIAGETGGGIPLGGGSFDSTHNGSFDAFVSKLSNFGFAPCVPQPQTQNASAPVGGLPLGNFQVNGQPGNNCTWTAISGFSGVVNVSFPASFAGNGQITYTVGANGGTNARFASIATADWLHNIAQIGTAANQVYNDVPTNHPFFLFISAMQQRDITRGCTATDYCPSATVTRGQMAVFIIRMLAGDNFAFPGTPRFTDVPANHQFFKYIQMMALLGITTGCAADRYCPDDPVTRGQMAVFILRALAGNAFPFPAGELFVDVPAAHIFFKYIQALFQRGITSGVSAAPLTYGVDQFVTREQMAAFLMRAFAVK